MVGLRSQKDDYVKRLGDELVRLHVGEEYDEFSQFEPRLPYLISSGSTLQYCPLPHNRLPNCPTVKHKHCTCSDSLLLRSI